MANGTSPPVPVPAFSIPYSPFPIPMQLALFDFDHTVTTCDSYSRFLRRVATPEQAATAKWKVGPWLLGYRAGIVSARSIRERVTRLTFKDRDAAEIAAHGEPYAPTRCRRCCART